jgi:gas vesicle protein
MVFANFSIGSCIEEDPMKPETKNVAKAVGAVVAGAAVGYVAGTLTAPAAGSETRRRIGRKIEEEAEDIARKAKGAVKDAKEKIAEAMHR